MYKAFQPNAEGLRELVPKLVGFYGTDQETRNLLDLCKDNIRVDILKLFYYSESKSDWVHFYQMWDNNPTKLVTRQTYTVSKIRRFSDMLCILYDFCKDDFYLDNRLKHPLLYSKSDADYQLFFNTIIDLESFNGEKRKKVIELVRNQGIECLLNSLAYQIDTCLTEHFETLTDSEIEKMLSENMSLSDRACIEHLENFFSKKINVLQDEPYIRNSSFVFSSYYHSLNQASMKVVLNDLSRVMNMVSELMPKQKKLFARIL